MVRNVASTPSLHKQGSEMASSSNPASSTANGPSAPATEQKMQDWQMQLMLLEQQNKKRLLMARQEQDMAHSTGQPGTDHNKRKPVPSDALPPSHINHARQDYEMQLMLLEQQNKKRLLLARQEQNILNDITDQAAPNAYAPVAEDFNARAPLPSTRSCLHEDCSNVSQPSSPKLMASKQNELTPAGKHHSAENAQWHLDLLEHQNKERQLLALQEMEMNQATANPHTPNAKDGNVPAAYLTKAEMHENWIKEGQPPFSGYASKSSPGPGSYHPVYNEYPLQNYQLYLMLCEQFTKHGKSSADVEAKMMSGVPAREIIAESIDRLNDKGSEETGDSKQDQLPTSGNPPAMGQQRKPHASPEHQLPERKKDKTNKYSKSAKVATRAAEGHYDEFDFDAFLDQPVAEGPSSDARLTAPFGEPPVSGIPYGVSDELSSPYVEEKSGRKNKKGKDKKKEKDKEKDKKSKKKVKSAYELLGETPKQSRIMATREAASVYCKPFCDFMTENPTVFHAVETQRKQLLDLGWTELNERKKWDIVPGGKYFTGRNGSSMIAFTVGENYEPGNGCAIIAGHVDALTAKLKPVSEVPNKAGYLQLGVAPYAGGMNSTWWDRDLGIGGRVLVKEDDKIVTKLVKLDWPIARIPTLAPHFGAAAAGPFNPETQMVPIIGLEGTETSFDPFMNNEPFSQPSIVNSGAGPVGNFVNTQPPRLVKHIGDALGLNSASYGSIVGWELELFDVQPATVGGLDKEFIFAGRIDDKLCSWAAMQALISGQQSEDNQDSSIIKMVGWFDDEEIGSQLRQGAKSNFLPMTIERIVGCLSKGKKGANLVGRTYANSFLVSSDVTHAVNPNFLNVYMENHTPHLNIGLTIHADPNGHMTTDAISTAILKRCADSVGAKLQVFQIRNDSRSGGTVGPMLSSMTGIRAIDAGVAQLSMHSIRATTGSLDPGLGVITYMAFLNQFERVDKEFAR